jgi:hypothetical protein
LICFVLVIALALARSPLKKLSISGMDPKLYDDTKACFGEFTLVSEQLLKYEFVNDNGDTCTLAKKTDTWKIDLNGKGILYNTEEDVDFPEDLTKTTWRSSNGEHGHFSIAMFGPENLSEMEVPSDVTCDTFVLDSDADLPKKAAKCMGEYQRLDSESLTYVKHDGSCTMKRTANQWIIKSWERIVLYNTDPYGHKKNDPSTVDAKMWLAPGGVTSKRVTVHIRASCVGTLDLELPLGKEPECDTFTISSSAELYPRASSCMGDFVTDATKKYTYINEKAKCTLVRTANQWVLKHHGQIVLYNTDANGHRKEDPSDVDTTMWLTAERGLATRVKVEIKPNCDNIILLEI